MTKTLVDEICDALDCGEVRPQIEALMQNEASRKALAEGLREYAKNTGTLEAIREYADDCFATASNLIYELAKCNDEKTSSQCRVSTILLHSALTSTNTVQQLTDTIGVKNKDAVIIARSVFETSLNAAYVVSAGKDVAELAEKHAAQKHFRDSDRKYQGVHEITLSRNPGLEIDENPYLKEAVELYTTRSGTEKRDWIDKNIPTRIKEISEKLDPSSVVFFEGAFFGIYRHSSEYLHGTFYGPAHFFGSFENDDFPGPVSVRLSACSAATYALTGSLFSLLNAVEVIASVLSLDEIYETAIELIQRMGSDKRLIGADGRT